MSIVWTVLEAILAAFIAEWKGLAIGIVLCLTILLFPSMRRRVFRKDIDQMVAADLASRQVSEDRIHTTDEPERLLAAASFDTLANIDAGALRALGIIACVPTLDESEWAPNDCRLKTKRSLKVMALQGSKWVDGDDAEDDFRKCLRRLKGIAGASVRFLLIDPFGAAIKDVAATINSRLDEHHDERIIQKYVDLLGEFDGLLEVRLYDHFPYFRIVIIDDREIAISRYKITEDRKFGWKSPHLILKEDDQPGRPDAISLFSAFEKHFDHVWFRLSTPLSDLIEQRERLRSEQREQVRQTVDE